MLSKDNVQPLWYICGTWNEVQDENLVFISVKFYQLETLSSIIYSADTMKDEASCSTCSRLGILGRCCRKTKEQD